jgi:hypothetical protein
MARLQSGGNGSQQLVRTEVNSIRIGSEADYSSDNIVLEQHGETLVYSDDSDGEDWVGVQAARIKDAHKPIGSAKFPKDVYKVLKKKAEKEERFPAAKHIRAGNWKPATVVEVNDGDQDIEMIEQEELKSVRFQRPKESVTKRVPTVLRPKLVDELKDTAKPEDMLKKILDQPVNNVTAREILANSPNLLRMTFKYLDAPLRGEARSLDKKQTKVGSHRTESSFYSVSTPKMKVRLNEEILVTAMVDSGAEINVMTAEVAERAGLAITPSPDLTIIGHGGERRRFEGVCEDTPIQIGGIIIYTPIFVVESADIPLILGQPFIFDSRLTLIREEDSQYITIPDPNSNQAIRVRVLQGDDVGNRVRGQIFPLN